ncbi:MAG: AbrB/MazE/SpoVT family DNA-binding domain-containing protein [Clostridia bacterium]|nr:AbrB/MazE/SpoVT family DNA-binding domain-containing protein [Clostridia bacterium]
MAKATGIVRSLDDLGRLVIPKELRRTMHLGVKDAVEIYVGDDDQIILKKYQPACIFCNETDNTVIYKGKTICKSCLKQINAAAERGEEG